MKQSNLKANPYQTHTKLIPAARTRKVPGMDLDWTWIGLGLIQLNVLSCHCSELVNNKRRRSLRLFHLCLILFIC
jgi:hypothetical protein